MALLTDGGRITALVGTDFGHLPAGANARRLAATWNAAETAELSTEALESDIVKLAIDELRRIEWSVAATPFRHCPSCDGVQDGLGFHDGGHQPGCRLAAVLRLARQHDSAAQSAADTPTQDQSR